MLVRKYTHICSFRKHGFDTKVFLILLMSAFFDKNNTFIQSNNVRAVLETF